MSPNTNGSIDINELKSRAKEYSKNYLSLRPKIDVGD